MPLSHFMTLIPLLKRMIMSELKRTLIFRRCIDGEFDDEYNSRELQSERVLGTKIMNSFSKCLVNVFPPLTALASRGMQLCFWLGIWSKTFSPPTKSSTFGQQLGEKKCLGIIYLVLAVNSTLQIRIWMKPINWAHKTVKTPKEYWACFWHIKNVSVQKKSFFSCHFTFATWESKYLSVIKLRLEKESQITQYYATTLEIIKLIRNRSGGLIM